MDERLYDLLEKVYTELTDFKNEMTDFKNEMTDFKNETSNRFDKVDGRLDKVDRRLDKIELMQEKMHKDIKTIAEVQANHIEQNEKQHGEILQTLNEKTSIIESAVKHLAGESTMCRKLNYR